MTIDYATDTVVAEPTLDAARDGEVLITIGTSQEPGIIRRWGTLSQAIGDHSLEAVVRGAVDPRVQELMREKRRAQYESERALVERVREVLAQGYRVFVHDSQTPVDSSLVGHLKARDLLKQGSTEYETQTFFTLHLILEAYGQAAAEEQIQEAVEAEEALATGSAFLHELGGDQAAGEPAEAPAAAYEPEEDEPITAAEESEPVQEEAAPEPAGPKLTKKQILHAQFADKIKALELKGLFVGNFGFQKEAVVDVSRLSALSPQTVSAYLMKANSFRQGGEHEKALSYYRVLLKSDPDNADFRFLYGKTLMEMGRTQAAVECLQRAKELGHDTAGRELERLTEKQIKKPGLHFLRFWKRPEGA